MSEEKSYIDKVLKTAQEMWGENEYKKMKDALEKTAKAVYSVSNYHLETDLEPATKPRPKET